VRKGRLQSSMKVAHHDKGSYRNITNVVFVKAIWRNGTLSSRSPQIFNEFYEMLSCFASRGISLRGFAHPFAILFDQIGDVFECSDVMSMLSPCTREKKTRKSLRRIFIFLFFFHTYRYLS
jgi:hypothetical protein